MQQTYEEVSAFILLLQHVKIFLLITHFSYSSVSSVLHFNSFHSIVSYFNAKLSLSAQEQKQRAIERDQ